MKLTHPYAVILVPSTAHALLVEDALRQAGLACKLVPVPRQVSSDCGVCVRIDPADKVKAESTCFDRGIEIDGIHELTR